MHVTYAIIDTSGVVWTGLSNGPSTASLLGFDPATVTASTSTLAVVAADTHGADGFTFDAFGNLWLTGGTTSNPGVARYPAAMLATDGVKTPDFTLNSATFDNAIPGPKVVTFNRDGDLWVSVVADGKVVKFDAAQLVAGGSTVPTVEQSGLDSPLGVAFDTAGNMWVASNGGNAVARINAAHLTTSGSGVDLTISALTGGVINGTLGDPRGLAFDAAGNLWVNYDGTIAELPASVLGGAGTITVTPPVQLETDVAALPEGIAFDEQGGLWFAYSAGRIARFAPRSSSVRAPPRPRRSSPAATSAAATPAGSRSTRLRRSRRSPTRSPERRCRPSRKRRHSTSPSTIRTSRAAAPAERRRTAHRRSPAAFIPPLAWQFIAQF